MKRDRGKNLPSLLASILVSSRQHPPAIRPSPPTRDEEGRRRSVYYSSRRCTREIKEAAPGCSRARERKGGTASRARDKQRRRPNSRWQATEAGANMRVEGPRMPSSPKCQLLLPTCWRLIFLFLAKILGCQVLLANCWSCSNMCSLPTAVKQMFADRCRAKLWSLTIVLWYTLINIDISNSCLKFTGPYFSYIFYTGMLRLRNLGI